VVAGALPAPPAPISRGGQDGVPALPPPKSSIDISRIDGQVR
jgi:hypothetical protein